MNIEGFTILFEAKKYEHSSDHEIGDLNYHVFGDLNSAMCYNFGSSQQ